MQTLFAVLVLALVLFVQVTPALAWTCTSHTYSYQGRMVTCTTCCPGPGWACHTTCF